MQDFFSLSVLVSHKHLESPILNNFLFRFCGYCFRISTLEVDVYGKTYLI
jgi:hypothetical protein